MVRRMELRQLRYFVAVADTGNISRAAQKIFLTQPALSRQIKALEEEIGQCLLERKAHSIRLTPAGEAMLREARELLQHANGAVERVRPKMMTVVAIMAGLVPILWSTGAGSEIMQRIAVPMIGGMVSSTLLTLIVIPAVYGLVKGFGLGKTQEQPPIASESVSTPVLKGASS